MTLISLGTSGYHVKKSPQSMQQCSNWGFRAMSGGSIAHASELKTLGRHSGEVWAVAITPDGLKAISASSEQTLKLWDLTSALALKIFTGHTDKVIAVAVTPQGRIAISGSVDNTLKLWDLTLVQNLKP